MTLRYRIYAIADVLATIFAVLLINWWAPLFARLGPITSEGKTVEGWRLPNWLKWFDTFDADLDTGRRDGLIDTKTVYWGRVQWLNRNPAYGFSYWALGVPFYPLQWRVVRCAGSEATHDLDFYAEGPDGQFNEHYIRDGKHVKKGFKAWNMYNFATGAWKPQPWGPEWRVPFVYSVSSAK